MIKNVFFLGSKKYGWSIIKALRDHDKDINLFFLHPDDRRDSRSYLNEIKELCKIHKIKFDLITKNIDLIRKFNKHKPEIILVHSYYKLIPIEIINKIKIGIFGFHNSLLPKYRGGAPLVWQILNNEKKIGSTLFKMNKNIDSGEIFFQISASFSKKSDINSISDELLKKWIKEIPKIWNSFKNGEIKLVKQNEKNASFFPNRKPEDGKINWSWNSNYIDRFIRAQKQPYPGAFFTFKDSKIYIKKYALVNKRVEFKPGFIIKNNESIIISCGNESGMIIEEIILNDNCISFYNFLKNIKVKEQFFPFCLHNSENI